MKKLVLFLFVLALLAVLAACAEQSSPVGEHCIAAMYETNAAEMFDLRKWGECHQYWSIVGFQWWQ